MREKIVCLGLLLINAQGFADAQAAEPKKNEIRITWLGHACFELVSSGGTDILIDPFLTKNPATAAGFKDLSRATTRIIFSPRTRTATTWATPWNWQR